MSAFIHMKGVKEFGDALTKMKRSVELASRELVTEGGAIIAEHAQREFTSLATSSSGTRVLSAGEKTVKGERVTGYRGNHVSGDRPHIRSGKLAKSVKVAKVTQMSTAGFKSETGPTMVYGRRVELGFHGTDSKGRKFDQRGYSYLRPGFDASHDDLAALYRRKWREAIRV